MQLGETLVILINISIYSIAPYLAIYTDCTMDSAKNIPRNVLFFTFVLHRTWYCFLLAFGVPTISVISYHVGHS